MQETSCLSFPNMALVPRNASALGVSPSKLKSTLPCICTSARPPPVLVHRWGSSPTKLCPHENRSLIRVQDLNPSGVRRPSPQIERIRITSFQRPARSKPEPLSPLRSPCRIAYIPTLNHSHVQSIARSAAVQRPGGAGSRSPYSLHFITLIRLLTRTYVSSCYPMGRKGL